MPCHRSCPDGNFPLDGLMQGRLDLVARCITSSMFISFGNFQTDPNPEKCLEDTAGLYVYLHPGLRAPPFTLSVSTALLQIFERPCL